MSGNVAAIPHSDPSKNLVTTVLLNNLFTIVLTAVPSLFLPAALSVPHAAPAVRVRPVRRGLHLGTTAGTPCGQHAPCGVVLASTLWRSPVIFFRLAMQPPHLLSLKCKHLAAPLYNTLYIDVFCLGLLVHRALLHSLSLSPFVSLLET